MINQNIRYLRKNLLKLTQEDFAESIGLQRNTISLIESGKLNTSERTLNDICKVHNINKEWLLNGEGEIFQQLNEDDEFSRLIGMLLADDDEFKKRIIKTMLELDDTEWVAIRNIVEKFAPK